MKRLLFLFVISFTWLISTHVDAQSARVDTPRAPRTIIVKDSIPKAKIGAKLGMSSNHLSGNLSFNQASTPGINVGGFLELRKKKIGVQVEAMISSSKHDLQDSFINGGSLSFIYLDVPVLFELKLLPGLWLQVGPQLGTLLSATQSPHTSLDPKSIFQSSNFSGVIGLEGKLPFHLSLGARYVAGFSNIDNGTYGNIQSPQPWKTTSIQVYLGFQFL